MRDQRPLRARLTAVITEAAWLSPRETADMTSLVTHGEPGVALENLCTQAYEHGAELSAETIAELAAIAAAMEMRLPAWIGNPGWVPGQQTLHFMYGPPGAGKTSLARQLAASLPAILFCEDEYLAKLPGAITSLEQLVAAVAQVRAVIEPQALRALWDGHSVVFDFAGNTVAWRAWVRALVGRTRAQLLLHVLDVPLDECKRRVRARNAEKPAGLYFGDVGDAVFDQVVPHIVPPGDDEGIPTVLASR